MPITPELAAVYGSAPTYKHYVETMSLHHNGFDGGVRYITNQVGGWVGLLEDGTTQVTYQYVPFAAVPPKEEEQSALSLQVAIDNSSRELVDELERAAGRPELPIIVYYRVYLSDDANTVQNDPPLRLDVAAVRVTQDAVAFTASLANLRRKPFPKMLYTTDLYPGLAR
jgi:hypothetical protein